MKVNRSLLSKNMLSSVLSNFECALSKRIFFFPENWTNFTERSLTLWDIGVCFFQLCPIIPCTLTFLKIYPHTLLCIVTKCNATLVDIREKKKKYYMRFLHNISIKLTYFMPQ